MSEKTISVAPLANGPHGMKEHQPPAKRLRLDDLVRDTDSVKRVLQRLHDSEGAFMFPTLGGDMNIVIRSDGDSEDSNMVFDLGFTLHADIAAMEVDGSVDESGIYVHQIITLEDTVTTEDLEFVRNIFNTSYRTKICECSERVVWDGYDICPMCDLCRQGEQTTGKICVICSEFITTARGCVTMACCQQTMHKSCRKRYEQDTSKTCPVCRA
jgi:hypothetical protein